MTVAKAFADAVLRLHLGQGGGEDGLEALQEAVVGLWEASAEGHACVEVDEPAVLQLLAASPAVATPVLVADTTLEPSTSRHGPAPDKPELSAPAPLVLDGTALYLQRLWQAESLLAHRLAMLDGPAPIAAASEIETLLDTLAPSASVDPLQRRAIATALTRRLAIVTGGPGTGKTTTIARLLVACMRLSPGMQVAIAAPTGKAAARLGQALAAQLAQLDPSGELARHLPRSGMTVHRLLGLRGDEGQANGDVRRYDLVIVDEASMLDLELARTLVESIPEDGRLVLAGDQDQLASVEAGAVFAELCASGLAGVTRLERNYRQAGAPALTALANWLRDRGGYASADAAERASGPTTAARTAGGSSREIPSGISLAPSGGVPTQLPLQFELPFESVRSTSSSADSALGDSARPDSAHLDSAHLDSAPVGPMPALPPFDPAAGVTRTSAASAEPIAAQALAAWEPAFAAIEAREAAPEVLSRFERHRVLCALREGPLGVAALNAAIGARVRRRLGARPGALWYPGRIVIVTRNRPELGLSNGDVGVCLPLPGDPDAQLAVAFDAGSAGLRWLPVRQMPSHEDGYAITVHKSQGSEFDSVALVPAPRGHRLNTRELLYTGATRARQRLAVWADLETLEDGAMRRSARHGRLADRLGGWKGPGDSDRRGVER